MKALEQLINTEKAALLHQLFPAEIPEFLKFAEAMTATITEEEQQQRERWQDGLLSFDFWLSLVKQAQQVIAKYGQRLSNSHRLFSEQLFDGYLAMFIVQCLINFTTARQHPNPKFTQAVAMLFGA